MEEIKIMLSNAIDILSDNGSTTAENTLLTISENLPAMPTECRENVLATISGIINDCDKIGLYSVGDILLETIALLRDYWDMPD